jgi:hypothetical protein
MAIIIDTPDWRGRCIHPTVTKMLAWLLLLERNLEPLVMLSGIATATIPVGA